jgi:dTMP kinase
MTAAVVDLSNARYGPLLKNTRFRRLWLSQFVSGVGDWLVIGLLIPLVTTLSGGSASAVAGIMIVKILPSLLLSSLVGVFVDWFDRRVLMIVCDAVRAVLTLGLLFTDSLAVIYAIVFLMEMASLFFNPAKSALVPYLVEEEDIAVANGLSYTTQQASMLIGLTASGAILAAFEAIVRAVLRAKLPVVDALAGPLAPALLGPRAGVVLNSLSFVVSAVFVLSIRVRARAGEARRFDLTLIGRDLVESFRFLKERVELRGLLVTVALALMGGGSLISVGLVHVQRNLVGGVPFLDRIELFRRLVAAPQTFMLVFIAFGMVCGALVVPRLTGRLPLQALFLGAVSAFGAGMAIFALSSAYWIAAVFAFAAGFCIATLSVTGNTYVVLTVSDELRGRVFTALDAVIRVSLLVSMAVVAPIGDLVNAAIAALVESRGIDPGRVWLSGPRLTLLLASALVLSAAWNGYRRLEWRRPEAAAEAPDA